jgi:hypothetical protein
MVRVVLNRRSKSERPEGPPAEQAGRGAAGFGLKLVLLALPLALSTGCFDDPNVGQTNTSETGGACPDGSAGCDCYGNSTCDAELLCEDGTCKLPECVDGSLNCDCYQGECFAGLLCTDGTCKPEDALPGCVSVSDCDGNLCTQGDQTCEGMCVAGLEVQCPLGATCDPIAGSCTCEPGSKPCGDVCIPDTQCCDNTDCSVGSTCADGFCTCAGGLVCGGECVDGAQCCPGEISVQDCTCGNKRTCMDSGMWTECTGGNLSPECEAGGLEECGNCGQRACSPECTWTPCQGEGLCEPGTSMCTGGFFSECTESCYWVIGENC